MITPTELKEASEQRIIKLSLKPNKNLPEQFNLNELNFKSADAIAKRILILLCLIGILYDRKRKTIKSLLIQHNVYNELSKSELRLLDKFFITKQDKVNIGWYSESIEV